MAQFIQSNQLSPIQGSAGRQTVVTDNGPTFGEGLQSAVQNIGGLIDTAGNIYGSNRAQSLVQEEVENIDRARAAAESGQFTAGDAVPDSIKLDQKEWDMMATAVQSGTMSREKARLLAASRLRSRISEEPLFADRMRKAASGILGFNIESEGARQYFASFPTQGQIGEGGNDILAKYAEQSDAWVALGIIEDRREGMKFQAMNDKLSIENEIAAAQAAAGVREANDMAGTLILNNNKRAWGTLLGELKAEQARTGQPVKPEQFTEKLRVSKQLFKENFDNKWLAAGGDLNSEEYNRHLSRVDQEYQEMEEFVTEYGLDNVMKLKIERQQQLFDMLGQQMFPQLTMITRTFGQRVASDLINLAATNSSQRDLLMSQNPELKRAFELMNSDPKAFTQKMMDVGTKLLNGETLTEADTPFLNHAAKTLHKNGSQETKEASVRSLADQGLDWKALSLVVDSRAYLEPEFSKQTFKTQYEQGMPAAVNQLAAEITATPGITATVNEAGRVVVSQDSAGGAMTQTGPGGLAIDPEQTQAQIVAFNRAQQLADKINLFSKGMERGYDQVVGKTREQHRNDLSRMLNDSRTNIQQNQSTQLQNNFFERLGSNDFDAARETFDRLKRVDPTFSEVSWDQMLQEAEEYLQMQQGGQ